ncbi:hypothetical protein LUZ60_003432 [Juncus effusus]|nr:hypothetical protein LUZ60_003432 [Juncus effusus]
MAEEEEEDQRAILAEREEEEEEEESDTESDADGFESEPDNDAGGGGGGAGGGGAKPPLPEITPDSSSSAAHQPILNPNPNLLDSNPGSGQNGPVSAGGAPSGSGGGERRVLAADDSRRLFQRLWTDEEELIILKGFLDFTSKRGTTFASHQYDTGPFYEEIKQRLQLDFSKNQLIEKLRRLKKKYRNCAGRIRSKGKSFSFRSPHEQAVFEIARHIWRPTKNSGDLSGDDDAGDDVTPAPANPSKRISRSRHRRKFQQNSETLAGLTVPVPQLVPIQVPVPIETKPTVPVPVPTVPVSSSASSGSLIEETVRTCLSPLFSELIGTAIGTVPLGLSSLGPVPVCPAGKISDEKWRQQYVLELEVYLRRMELVKEQVLCALQELRERKS